MFNIPFLYLSESFHSPLCLSIPLKLGNRGKILPRIQSITLNTIVILRHVNTNVSVLPTSSIEAFSPPPLPLCSSLLFNMHTCMHSMVHTILSLSIMIFYYIGLQRVSRGNTTEKLTSGRRKWYWSCSVPAMSHLSKWWIMLITELYILSFNFLKDCPRKLLHGLQMRHFLVNDVIILLFC